MYYKLLSENALVNFPAILRPQESTSPDAMIFANAMEALRHMFDNKLRQLTGDQWIGLEKRLRVALQHWLRMGDSTLYYQPELATPTPEHVRTVLRGNLHVLNCVTELVFSTRYPAQHDKVRRARVLHSIISYPWPAR